MVFVEYYKLPASFSSSVLGNSLRRQSIVPKISDAVCECMINHFLRCVPFGYMPGISCKNWCHSNLQYLSHENKVMVG